MYTPLYIVFVNNDVIKIHKRKKLGFLNYYNGGYEYHHNKNKEGQKYCLLTFFSSCGACAEGSTPHLVITVAPQLVQTNPSVPGVANLIGLPPQLWSH